MTVRAPLSTTTWPQATAAREAVVGPGVVIGREVGRDRLEAVAGRGHQAGQLADVRRQHAGPGDALPPGLDGRERVEPLGVDDDRRPLALGGQEVEHEVDGRQARPQPGSDDGGVVVEVEELVERRRRRRPRPRCPSPAGRW